jgi:hypothetical protein
MQLLRQGSLCFVTKSFFELGGCNIEGLLVGFMMIKCGARVWDQDQDILSNVLASRRTSSRCHDYDLM